MCLNWHGDFAVRHVGNSLVVSLFQPLEEHALGLRMFIMLYCPLAYIYSFAGSFSNGFVRRVRRLFPSRLNLPMSCGVSQALLLQPLVNFL